MTYKPPYPVSRLPIDPQSGAGSAVLPEFVKPANSLLLSQSSVAPIIAQWILGGDSACFSDVDGYGHTLVPVSGDPIYDDNIVATKIGINGLGTGIADAAEQTVACLFRHDAGTGNSNRMVFGNFAADATGWALYWDQSSAKYYISSDGIALNTYVALPSGVQVGDLLFASVSFSTTRNSRIFKWGDKTGTPHITTTAGSKVVASRAVAFGNGYYNNSGMYVGPSALAMGAIINRGLSAADMEVIYQNFAALSTQRGDAVI